MLDTLARDLRFSLRQLRKSPGFTLAAVVSLGLGIGATATVFSWIKGLMLEPLPGTQAPGRLLVLAGQTKSGGFTNLSYPDYADLRDGARASTLLAYQLVPMSLTWGHESERVFGQIVSANFFDVLGVRPARGRGFRPEEEETGAAPVAVISHSLWTRRFGSDPDVVGREITLNGQPFTLAGVTPEDFHGSMAALSLDVFVPLGQAAQVAPGTDLEARRSHWLEALVRPRPGVGKDEALAELKTLTTGIRAAHPESLDATVALFPFWRAPWGASSFLAPVLTLLMAVVSLVLLIACTNVANLLLGRAFGRRREVAIRLAQGASPAQLVRQLLTESVVLAGLAGLVGAAVAQAASGLLLALVPAAEYRMDLVAGLDPKVLAFTGSVSLLVGLVMGLVPAREAAGQDVASVLKDEAGAAIGGGGRRRLRSGLVVAQVALSFVILTAAGLFLRSFEAARRANPGFEPQGVLLAKLDLFPNGYDEARGKAFLLALIERVRALPGVTSATVARSLPFDFEGYESAGLKVDGYEPLPNEEVVTAYNPVGADYLKTMRVPVVAGRDFTTADTADSQPAAVVNESFARRYLKGREALGARLTLTLLDRTFTIVGVAADSKYESLAERPHPFLYLSAQQVYSPQMVLHVRSEGDPAALSAPLRAAMRSLDPALPLFRVSTLRQHMAVATFRYRVAAILFGVLGVGALLLASLGLYSVIAYTVAQRTREMGLRVALGADPKDILRLVIHGGMRLAGAGLSVGLVLAFALLRFLASVLFGVGPADLPTFAMVFAVLAAVAFVAAYVPARRATRVDPLVALRYE